MNKSEVLEIVKNLEFDRKKVIYQDKEVQVFILRPSKLSKRFKNYDVEKNFQVWLKKGDREFRPNHLQVFIDLNLRTRSKPELKNKLLLAFDNIFYGADPETELSILSKENFKHYLTSLVAIGVMTQLFIVEQEYAYYGKSKYEPPTLFFQGWIREFIDNPKEIDNLCMSVANRQSPADQYTVYENKKNKKYNSNLKPLWYVSTENNKLKF